jgi:hypothetical protein
MKHRLACIVCLRVRDERLVAKDQHLVTVGAQLQWLRRMVIRDEQVTTAFGQLHHRVMHVQRDEPALDRAEALAQVQHPVREEHEGQRVRHCEFDHVLSGHLMAGHHVDLGDGAPGLPQGLTTIARSGEARGKNHTFHSFPSCNRPGV